jgi:nucleoside-diphosphate-sugar epimerase
VRIAVTGATGFLGGRVVAEALARGHEVVALGRDVSRGAALAKSGARFYRCDLADAATMRRRFEGADAVVHSAALSSPWGTRKAFEAANVVGTRNVVQAADRSGVRRLVHVSTPSIYFEFTDRLGIREDDPLPKPVNEYARTKLLAETEAAAFGGELFVLRPRGIFGPGDTTILPRLLAAARKGGLPLLRGGNALVDLTYVDVVADAVIRAVEAPAEARGTYNVTNGKPVAVKWLVERVTSCLGVKFLWKPAPVSLTIAAARGLELAARIDPRKPEPRVTAYGVGLLAYSQTLDISAARDRLGWTPGIPIDEALDRTILALRHAP